MRARCAPGGIVQRAQTGQTDHARSPTPQAAPADDAHRIPAPPSGSAHSGAELPRAHRPPLATCWHRTGRTSSRDAPACPHPPGVTCTSTNFGSGAPCASRPASASRSRFFQAKKYGAHNPRSRQNAATLCPLRPCSLTSFRHFPHTCLLLSRCVMQQPCYTHPSLRKMRLAYRSPNAFGKDGFREYLVNLRVRRGFNNLRHVVIFRDCDENGEAAFRDIVRQIREAGRYDVPTHRSRNCGHPWHNGSTYSR